MSGAVFSPAVRAAVLERTNGRCAGCGAAEPITIQHRRARKMGGRHGADAGPLAEAANGLALCGSGTTGCHGWAEHHPIVAHLLGWALHESQDPTLEPYWCVQLGWRRVLDDASHVYVDAGHLDRPRARSAALENYSSWINRRTR